MERILEYYAPDLSFDVQSLRKAAEELKSKHRGSDSDGPSTKVDVDELDDLAIEDEDFMIKAMPDNTTRASPRYCIVEFELSGQNILASFRI